MKFSNQLSQRYLDLNLQNERDIIMIGGRRPRPPGCRGQRREREMSKPVSLIAEARGLEVCAFAGMKPYMQRRPLSAFPLARGVAGCPENRPIALRCRDFGSRRCGCDADIVHFYQSGIGGSAGRLQTDFGFARIVGPLRGNLSMRARYLATEWAMRWAQLSEFALGG